MAENTFLGLQPYTEDDAYRFKGRTEESQELFRLIVRNDFTVCYAESGEGKTSLLNAGVFPLLRENMYFPIAITFTSDDYQVTPDNFSTIIDRCIKDSITEYNEKNKGVRVEYKLCSTDFQGLDCQAELQQELNKYSWWKLRNYKPQAMGLTFTPVFVFDQFEEVFNMPGSIVWTKKFFDWLEDVSSDSCPDEIAKKIRAIIGTNAAFPNIKEEKDFKTVFSLRKEFIGELDYWGMQKCFIPSLKDNRYCLKALTYEGAKKVMTQQERFDEEKVEQILTHFVKQYSREPEKTIKEQLPIIPALLLSVVCDSWEKDISSFAKLSTDEISQSLNKILEKFYDDTIDAVIKELGSQNASPLDSDSIRKDIDVAMFDLVDVNGKRVRVKAVTTLGTISMESKKRFSETLPIVKYKEILNQHRVVKITKIDGEDYVEIVHDCLCPIIKKRRSLLLAAATKEIGVRERKKLMHLVIRRILAVFFLFGIVFAVWYYGQKERFLLQVQKNETLLLQRDSIKNQALLLSLQKDSLNYQLNIIISQSDSLNLQSSQIRNQRDSLKHVLIDLVSLKARHDSIKYLLSDAQISAAETARERNIETSFTRMQGRLPVPVNGDYKVARRYGEQIINGVSFVNKGITFQVSSNETIHSIYEGTVSSIFSYAGSLVVMIRHGYYISIYVNLKSINVKREQIVQSGETIGIVNDDNHLDFQLRYMTDVLNPELWLNVKWIKNE